MSQDSLGDRIKEYEEVWRIKLPRRVPVIIRLDGKAFHTFTKSMEKPFDKRMTDSMQAVTIELCREIQGACFAYTQSDEISILINNFTSLDSQAWFDNNLQKMISVSASIASSLMTVIHHRTTLFDSRVFILPEHEINNYFIWRQQDATRNSVQMLARSLYSHSECNNKNNVELQEMCFEKGMNWNDVPVKWKRGSAVYKKNRETTIEFFGMKSEEVCIRSDWYIDRDIPIFTENRTFITEQYKTNE